MFIVGCGEKTTTWNEVEEIYEKVFENYHEAQTLIYGTSIELGEEIIDEKGQIYLVVEEPAYQDMESIQNVLKLMQILFTIHWHKFGDTNCAYNWNCAD